VFIDSHAHLEGKRFGDELGAVLQRAQHAGVTQIVAIGTGDGPGTLDCAVRIAEQHANVLATIGIHPHEASMADEAAYAQLQELARHPKVVAWGEIGLDYYYDHSPREVQQQVFRRQMEMAREAKLPIVIHCRPPENSENAWDDTIRLLHEHWEAGRLGGILHCFTGGLQHMRAALDIGFLISFAGNVTFPKAERIRRAAVECPLDRMLIETDSPFLAPVPFRGKRNEPAFVVKTAEHIAGIRGVSVEEVAHATSSNFHRLFEPILNRMEIARQTGTSRLA
jgi:TatD DNase family protein